MPTLDVHVLIHPTTPQAWVTQCLDSVRAAIALAGYPVALHTLPAVLGHIGRARRAGYGLGTGEYVTSVDDDDWIEPGAFAVLAACFVDRPASITTRMYAHQNGKQWVLPWREALRVFHRDVVESAPLEDWAVNDGPRLVAHADALGASVNVRAPLYHYRVRADSPHRALLAMHREAA